jgi:hypothetical protein
MRRATVVRALALFFAGVILSACAQGKARWYPVGEPVARPPGAFQHERTTEDLKLYWSCTFAPGLLRVDGIAENVGQGEVRTLLLQVNGLDSVQHRILRSSAGIPDVVLYPMDRVPFHLDMKPTGAEVRFDFFYQYEVLVVHRTLPPVPPVSKEFTIRDVCKPGVDRSP